MWSESCANSTAIIGFSPPSGACPRRPPGSQSGSSKRPLKAFGAALMHHARFTLQDIEKIESACGLALVSEALNPAETRPGSKNSHPARPDPALQHRHGVGSLAATIARNLHRNNPEKIESAPGLATTPEAPGQRGCGARAGARIGAPRACARPSHARCAAERSPDRPDRPENPPQGLENAESAPGNGSPANASASGGASEPGRGQTPECPGDAQWRGRLLKLKG